MKLKKPNLGRFRLTTAQWWLISLITVFVLTALLTFHAVFLFIRTAQADVIVGGTGVPVESISREALKEIIRAFEARAEHFKNLKVHYEGVSDPSL